MSFTDGHIKTIIYISDIMKDRYNDLKFQTSVVRLVFELLEAGANVKRQSRQTDLVKGKVIMHEPLALAQELRELDCIRLLVKYGTSISTFSTRIVI